MSRRVTDVLRGEPGQLQARPVDDGLPELTNL
jgi:hypothetical protein